MDTNNTNLNNNPEDDEKGPNNYETLDAYLSRTKIALTNSSYAEIASVLTTYGYPATKIAEGVALHADAEKKQKDQIKEYGEQFTATDALHNAILAVSIVYIEHLELARIAFKKQRGVLSELAANGERKKTQDGYLSDATTFYKNLLAKPAYVAAMAKYGQTEEILNDGFDLVKTANNKLAEQRKEQGEAQTATKKRDIAVNIFSEWYTDFIGMAKIALKNKPELLEILGVKM